MSKMWLITIVVVLISIIAWFAIKAAYPGPPPQLDQEEWWGPREAKGRQNTAIRPFQIKFSEEMVIDLKQRLKSLRPQVPPLEEQSFEYGFNSNQLETWTKYWAEEYPFAAREKFLNTYPQFKTNIQGLDIHFIRVKPEVPAGVTVVPLLLVHGWPGSVREFYEAIPLLTQQRDDSDFVFEVIAPSLPGYGFSDTTVRPGLGPVQIAVVFKNLMSRLGYNKYYIQGGDWGSIIVAAMATMYPDHVLGQHSNMLFVSNGCSTFRLLLGSIFPSLIIDSHLADRIYPLTKYIGHLAKETGYMHLQASKPDTIGVALSDSPNGLLAYILEKFSSWTKWEHRHLQDGGLTIFTKEQLVDNLMIYWSSNSITTSMRLYAEAFSKKNSEIEIDRYYSEVPVWGLQVKNELFYQPPSVLKAKYTNLLGVTTLDKGGHFVALELPQVFVDDVFKAVKAFKVWHQKRSES